MSDTHTHQGGAGPLQGLKVLELASIGPGPMAATLLADLGASVTRIDRLEDSGLGVAVAPRFHVHGRSRRSVALDLKTEAGRSLVLELVERSDVLIEGFRPGVMERLGLGPAPCQARQPRLIYGRMTGYGQHGPLAQSAGHDLNYLALSGALHAIGTDGGKPVPPLNLVADYGGGALYLVMGVLAALFERHRSGLGQVVDAAMVDGVASLAGLFFGLRAAGDWSGPRGTNLLDGGAPFYDTYATADGRYLSLAPVESKFFAQLARALELDERYVQGQYDRTLWPEMRGAIAAAVAQRTRDDWCQRLEGTDACVAPVLTFDEAPNHAHARARGAFVEVDGVGQPSPAPRFDRTPLGEPRPAPQPGADTEAVLAELGWDGAAIAALRADGVVA